MRYHTPASFQEAASIAVAASGKTRFLAGGTDVLVRLRAGIEEPDDLIDLKHIPGAAEILRMNDGGWSIGAAVPAIALTGHAQLAAEWPGVIEGMGLVGSTQVQGRATPVGNLCNGSPAADSVPGLIAADALVEVTGPQGTRMMPVSEIPAGPGKNSLAPGEIVSRVIVPPRKEHGGDAYLRFIPRTEMDIAVAACAVNIQLADDRKTVAFARVVPGAVNAVIAAVPAAADVIIGTCLEDDAIKAMVAAVRAAAKPISDKRGSAEFRTQVVGVMAERAARIAYARAKGEHS